MCENQCNLEGMNSIVLFLISLSINLIESKIDSFYCQCRHPIKLETEIFKGINGSERKN